jgi:diguanylate cyclase (GGDEF)-like protein/PAS domain S-box-containing protein
MLAKNNSIIILDSCLEDAHTTASILHKDSKNKWNCRICADPTQLNLLLSEQPSFIIAEYDFGKNENVIALLERTQSSLIKKYGMIIVSYTTDLKAVAGCFRHGVYDYLAKNEDLAQNLPKALKTSILKKRVDDILQEHNEFIKALVDKQEFIRTMLDTIPSPIFFTDRQGRIKGRNKAFDDTFDVAQKNLTTTRVWELIEWEDPIIYQNHFDQCIRNGELQRFEMNYRFRNDAGSVIVNQTAFRDSEGVLIGIIANFTDITEQKAREETLHLLSEQDQLTNVVNRRGMEHRLKELHSLAITNKEHLSIALIDVDDFKLYNDHYGHQLGDICLRRIATVLKKCLRRDGEFVARYGGEEFLIALPGQTSVAAAKTLEYIRNEVYEMGIKHKFSQHHDTVTISTGFITMIPGANQSINDLIEQADKGLYLAKHHGKNTVCLLATP